ncbi:hypothetical protein GCM10023093_00950 [Nemorincola caseinilytica]|uniref:Uncharacterized protein n=1 Tax=Nemorincola caseinilytica TaxID=2054315 RepID=A0ABP8N4W9_9BACT
MKNILMTLALITFGCAGVEAQINCTVVPKQKVTTQVQQTNQCKLVPKDVCTISPDRRSVTCHKTVDGQNFTPYGRQTTYYGPTGPIPGSKAKFETETVVIKGNDKPDHCTRDEANRTTYCYYKGYRICRDENGFYSTCFAPGNGTVKAGATKLPGNNGVVLK